jgi:hypothetical protein
MVLGLSPAKKGLLLMGDTTPAVGIESGFQNLLSTLYSSSLSSIYRQEHGQLIFDIGRRLLVSLTQNPAAAQRMFLVLVCSTACFSMNVLLSYLGISRYTSFLMGLSYGFCANQFNFLAFGWIWVALTLAITPFLILSISKALKSPTLQHVVISGLTLGFVAFLSALMPMIYTLFFIIIICTSVNQKQNLVAEFKLKLRPLHIGAAIALLSILPNFYWIATRFISPPSPPLTKLAVSPESIGTSINVKVDSALILWGTGFNNSVAHIFPKSLVPALYLLPILAFLSICFSWNRAIPRLAFWLFWTMLITLTLLDQVNLIKALDFLGLGRDSARLYSLAAVPLFVLAAHTIDSIGLYKPVLIKLIPVVIFALSLLPFMKTGLEAERMPPQPALSLVSTGKSLSTIDDLSDYLNTNYPTDFSLLIPSRPFVAYADNPKFQPDFHLGVNISQFLPRTQIVFASSRMKSGKSYVETVNSILLSADPRRMDLLMRDLGCRLLIFHIPSLSTEDKRLLEQLDPKTSGSKSYQFFDEITNLAPANFSKTFRVFTRIADTSQFVVVAEYNDGSLQTLKHSVRLNSLAEFTVTIPQIDATRHLENLTVRFSAAFERNWQLEVSKFISLENKLVSPVKNITHRMGSNLSVLQNRDDYSNEYNIEFVKDAISPISLEVKVKFSAEQIQRRLFFAQLLLMLIALLILSYRQRRNSLKL